MNEARPCTRRSRLIEVSVTAVSTWIPMSWIPMRSPSRLSFAPTSSESFQTHHEAAPSVRGRFPEPNRAMRRIPTPAASRSPFNALLASDIGQMLIKCPTPVAGRWYAWNRNDLPAGLPGGLLPALSGGRFRRSS
jgi:hypothetical protein